MANRFRGFNEARRTWAGLARAIGDELRSARILSGATQRQVSRAIGVSPSEVSRRELGHSTRLTGEKLAVHAAAVGLRLWVKLYPTGAGVRDEAQSRYVAAFLARVGRLWRVTLEAVVPLPGDLRAADILLIRERSRIVVEVITRVGDLQAQIRAAETKARDMNATRLILLVADTHANARVIGSRSAALVAAFDLDSRRILRELTAGGDPGRDALILFRLGRSSAGGTSARPHRPTGRPRASRAT